VKKRGAAAEKVSGDKLDAIKKLAVVAMFSDDELLDQLVLKGGNAMELVHKVNARASVDLDFSMKDDFDHAAAQARVERALLRTFELDGYLAFDIKMTVRPGKMPDELAAFWGGYLVEFKLISIKRADEVGRDIDQMRREAIQLGEGSRFTIDISRHEYTDDKQEAAIDGYQIYVYSPEMIVCEKLRAICQQMPDYGAIINRKDKGNQRARDFIDIEALVKKFTVDVTSARAQHMIEQMFALKRVPLSFLGRISEMKDFHGHGFGVVKATMKPGVKIEPWDYYFEFVLDQCRKLEPFWHV
jgi:hypothetical protein